MRKNTWCALRVKGEVKRSVYSLRLQRRLPLSVLRRRLRPEVLDHPGLAVRYANGDMCYETGNAGSASGHHLLRWVADAIPQTAMSVVPRISCGAAAHATGYRLWPWDLRCRMMA